MKTEAAMITVAAHNEHENLGRRQWGGGTGIVAWRYEYQKPKMIQQV